MFEQFVEENHHPLFNFPQAYSAYLDCRRTKRNSLSALTFEVDHEANLLMLVDELREGRYKPGTSVCFYTRKPKCREIFAAHFRDRIVHHIVFKKISPVWEKIFIHHSYACRPGKGTHAAANAVQKFLRVATFNCSRRAYFLKLDIKNFFMSIDREILFKMLISKCPQGYMRDLLRTIVFHDPTVDYELQDRQGFGKILPRHKSLFYTKPICGLPIGNLTSQFFANVYLNALDQFIKHRLKARFYVRYVDDLVLVHADPERLRYWQGEIERFLKRELKLSINHCATRLAPVSGGVDFVGFIIRSGYKLVRRRVIGNLKIKLRVIGLQLVSYEEGTITYKFDQEIIENCLATVNSYLGHFKHAKTHRIIKKIWQLFPFLRYYFRQVSGKVVRHDRPLKSIVTMRQQIRWLSRNYNGFVCITQIGCYFECFDRDAVVLSKISGYRLRQNWRGFRYGCGFPKGLLEGLRRELQVRRIPYIIVRQTGRELYRSKERLLFLLVRYEDLKQKKPISA